jgi:peroxiredoxin
MLLDTPICDFGFKAPEFTLKDAHGKSYTMSDHLGEKGLLVMFICNHCPYVIRIAEQLGRDTQTLIDEGVNVIAIMSNDYNDYEEDSPENMIKFAQKHHFNFPYLIDEDQSVGKAYGTVCTPDFFGFNSKGELQYRGRFDNIGMNDKPAERVAELVNAMRLIAETGKGPENQMPSMGCSIKWKS